MSAVIIWMLFGFVSNVFGMEAIEIPDIHIESNHYQGKNESETETAVILEVTGNPKEKKRYIETYYPSVKVVAVYTILFQGIAVKGNSKEISQLTELEFVKGKYPVQTYRTLDNDVKQFASDDFSRITAEEQGVYLPFQLNNTDYTGKGVKVAVIDTGIDFNHPDLKKNFKGGYDLVDLDDEPMETTKEEGLPTYHGSHVAGIIAADGVMKGVAPDSEIYAYRALGPGGSGTSVQVIAAMEEAVKQEVDVMNLSLGNSINHPDYPTSKAVNEAVNRGIAVVIANGNDGPDNWTAGSPATAPLGLAVGALATKASRLIVEDPKSKKTIPLTLLKPLNGWDLERDYQITTDPKDASGKIGLIILKNEAIVKQIEKWTNQGAQAILIDTSEAKAPNWFAEIKEMDIDLPIAIISKEDSQYIKEHLDVYYKSKTDISERGIAPFSSRGPTAMNWMMKPDITAPGVQIVSTVPGGYDVLNGTSMAAPHVAGAIAVIKEARPEWTTDQIISALKTTAQRVEQAQPNEQGAGNIQIKEAIDTDIIIRNSELSFGRLDDHLNERTLMIEIENVSNEVHTLRFSVPKKERALSWELPMPVRIKPGATIELPITLTLNSMQLDEEFIQGWISLKDKRKTYELPFLAVNKKADHSRIMGFEFYEQDKEYVYTFYAAENLKKMTVKLYDPVTLVYKGDLWQWKDIKIGKNSGELAKSRVPYSGIYYGLIIAETENGEIVTDHTDILISE